jgi:hypothetical protein
MSITTSLVEHPTWELPISYNREISDKEIRDVKLLKQSNDISEKVHEFCATMFTTSHQQILSKALRLKEFYKTDFYPFLHGMESRRAPLIWLLKELAKRKNPQRDMKLFKPLRFEDHITPKHISEFLNAETINDHTQRTDLISVVANFLQYNMSNIETPNDACRVNRSVCSIQENGQADILSVLQRVASEKDRDRFLAEFMNIVDQFSNQTDCGSLAVICVPKINVQDWVYRAHPPLGEVCRCTHTDNDLPVLNDAQRDISFKNLKGPETPFLLKHEDVQYRILASHLKPENGIRIFLLTPNRDAMIACKKSIKELANRIFLSPKFEPMHIHLQAVAIIVGAFVAHAALFGA